MRIEKKSCGEGAGSPESVLESMCDQSSSSSSGKRFFVGNFDACVILGTSWGSTERGGGGRLSGFSCGSCDTSNAKSRLCEIMRDNPFLNNK